MAMERIKHAGGRPPLVDGQRCSRVTITIPAALLEWCRVEGAGNVSLGVRRLLEELDQQLGQQLAEHRASMEGREAAPEGFSVAERPGAR